MLFPGEMTWVSLSPELAWITVNCYVDRNLAFQHCFGGGDICWHPLKWWRCMQKILSKNKCEDFAFKMRSNFIRSKNPSWRAGLEWRTALCWEIFTAGWGAPCVPFQIALQHVKKKHTMALDSWLKIQHYVPRRTVIQIIKLSYS